jgi:hypothetical protein
MKFVTILFFCAFSFLAESQVFLNRFQLGSECVNINDSIGFYYGYSGCAFDVDDNHHILSVFEYEFGNPVSIITFNPETGLIQSTQTPYQHCDYFEDGRLSSRTTWGENKQIIYETIYKIEKEKYFLFQNLTYDNSGKLIDCSGKGCK